jgi:hypothetical protein
MDYAQRDHDAIIAMDDQQNVEREVTVTILPPQKVPRWARSYTAVARGTSIGNGNYVRLGGNSE